MAISRRDGKRPGGLDERDRAWNEHDSHDPCAEPDAGCEHDGQPGATASSTSGAARSTRTLAASQPAGIVLRCCASALKNSARSSDIAVQPGNDGRVPHAERASAIADADELTAHRQRQKRRSTKAASPSGYPWRGDAFD